MINAKNMLNSQAIEIQRRGRHAVIALTGIVGVEDFSCVCITLITHSGRIKISGKSLSLSLFEGRTVEIRGNITGVQM